MNLAAAKLKHLRYKDFKYLDYSDDGEDEESPGKMKSIASSFRSFEKMRMEKKNEEEIFLS